MKRRFLVSLLACLTLLFGALGLIACGENNPPSSNNLNNQPNSNISNNSSSSTGTSPEGSKLIFKTLKVENGSAYFKVSNTTKNFSFLDEIQTNETSNFIVSSDAYAQKIHITKNVSLNTGENLFYIFETMNGDIINSFNITIYRRSLCQF